jgi:hypothetical protein
VHLRVKNSPKGDSHFQFTEGTIWDICYSEGQSGKTEANISLHTHSHRLNFAPSLNILGKNK